MAVAGRKPKGDQYKVTRHALTQEWVDVPDVPFQGCGCADPGGAGCGGTHIPSIGRVTAKTRRWWAALSRMPHCILWSETEWEFAVQTAALHNAFAKGDLARHAELRICEKELGLTLSSRRDLRIRYVSPSPADTGDEGGQVTDFEAERRRRLLDGE